MDSEAKYQNANAGWASAAQNAFTVPAPPMTLADRLANFIQSAHASSAALSAARERLCGIWPEANTAQSGPKAVQSQIEGMLDELHAALTRIADHTHAINSRI